MIWLVYSANNGAQWFSRLLSYSNKQEDIFRELMVVNWFITSSVQVSPHNIQKDLLNIINIRNTEKEGLSKIETHYFEIPHEPVFFQKLLYN